MLNDWPRYSRQMLYFYGYSGEIIDFQRADVNGDRVFDNVYLLGKRPMGLESPFVENVALVVQDGATGSYFKVDFKNNSGYNPTIFLGDFTGDKVNDILVRIDSGGSGGYLFAYVYSFLNNIPKECFDFNKFNEKYKYVVTYKDDYKVEIDSSLNKRYTVDIQYKGKEYLSQIYDEQGRLKEAVKGDVLALGGVYPIDLERKGTNELIAEQRIIGKNNSDTLGFVETMLKWDGKSFIPFVQNVLILGA